MSRKRPTPTAQYEILYIVANKFSEDELTPIQEKVKTLLSANQGVVKNSHFWGKKKLSYPIKQTVFGYYTLLECEIPGASIAEIDRSMRIMPEVLRHILVKIEPNRRKPAAHRTAPVKKEEKTESVLKPEVLKKDISRKKEVEKMDLKDLDESLDKLLDVDNLL